MRSPSLPQRTDLRSRKVPLRLVLVIPFVLQVSLAVGLTGYFSWHNGQQAVHDLANQVVREVGDRVHLKLETYLAQPHQINALNATAIHSSHVNIQNAPVLQEHFWQQLQVFDSISSIYIGTVQGELYGVERLQDGSFALATSVGRANHTVSLYRFDDQGKSDQLLQVFPRMDMRQRPWFKAAVNTGRATWSEIYSSYPSQDLGITAVYPIYSTTGQLETVVASDLMLWGIDQFLQQQNLGRSGQIFIIERCGKLVSTSTRDAVAAKVDGKIERVTAVTSANGVTRFVAKRLLEFFPNFKQIHESQTLSITDDDGRHYFLRVSPLQDKYGLNWLIVAAVPESDFMQQINANFRITVLLCAGALVMAIALGFLTTNWIVRPILRLSRASRNVALGEWDYPVRQDSAIAELEVLARSYNQMATQLWQSFDQVKIALQESEEKFTKIFRTSPAPILIATRAEGKFLEANESLFQFSGYCREEVIGRTVLELGLWSNQEDRDRYLHLIQQDGKIRQMECSVRIKSGEIKTMLLSAEVLELDGQMCVLAVGKDISDRKQAEAALQQSEEKFRTLVANLPGAVYRCPHSEVWQGMYISDAITDIAGYPAADFAQGGSRSFFEIVHPDDVQSIQQIMDVVLESRQCFNLEYRIIYADGSIRWVYEQGQGVFAGDQLCWVDGVLLDITDRKRAEEALLRSEERYRAIVNTQTELVIRSTPETVMTFVNEATCRLTGYTQEQIIGHPWHEFIVPEDLEATLNQVPILSYENPEFTSENRIRLAGGQVHWFEWTNQGIFDDQGQLVEIQSVGRNITKRKQAESALQLVNERLKAKVRGRTVDLFRIHHQLRHREKRSS